MNNFGFKPNQKNPHETIYHDYIEKPVRVDVAGGIGGTGIMKTCNPHNNGHLIYLSPFVFHANDNPRIIFDKEVLINTNGNPVSIYPLGKSLEKFVEETKEHIAKMTNKDNK